jgi:hypothetical protein
VDLGGCLDSTVIGPYRRSRAAREEKTVRRRDQGPAWPQAQRRKEIRKTKRPTDPVLVKHKDEANGAGYPTPTPSPELGSYTTPARHKIENKRRNNVISMRAAVASTPHGGANFGGQRRLLAHRPSNSGDKMQDKCGVSWRKEKGPVRVPLTRHPLIPLPKGQGRLGLGQAEVASFGLGLAMG